MRGGENEGASDNESELDEPGACLVFARHSAKHWNLQFKKQLLENKKLKEENTRLAKLAKEHPVETPLEVAVKALEARVAALERPKEPAEQMAVQPSKKDPEQNRSVFILFRENVRHVQTVDDSTSLEVMSVTASFNEAMEDVANFHGIGDECHLDDCRLQYADMLVLKTFKGRGQTSATDRYVLVKCF